MNCPTPQLLAQFANNRVTSDQRAEIDAHIRTCERCAASLQVGSSTEHSAPSMHSTAVSTSSSTTEPRTTLSPTARGSTDLHQGVEVLGYRLLTFLGEGGMGVTWSAKREHEIEPVAIKTLPAALRGVDAELERVRRVFDLVKALRHPNIAMVYQLGVDPIWGPVIVMELVQGITLRRFATMKGNQSAALPIQTVIDILEPVAKALDYSHSCDVVHRDVKPSNIMLNEDCTGVRLIDFGLGDEIRRSVSYLSVPYTTVEGTAVYMSPEQWRGHIPSPASDEYALGCVAYEMLAGHPPFVASGSDLLRRCHLEEPVPPIVGYPQELNDVLWRENSSLQRPCAMAKERKHRFTSCIQLINTLRSVSARHSPGQKIEPSRPAGSGTTEGLPFVRMVDEPGVLQFRDFRDAQKATARILAVPITLELATGDSMVLVPRGSFVLGMGRSPSIDETGEKRPRRVTIEAPYYLARWPVTIRAWCNVMGSRGSPSVGVAQSMGALPRMGWDAVRRWLLRGKVELPAHKVSWESASHFLKRLNILEKEYPGLAVFRLPSEVEWEFACRAGSTASYCFGDNMGMLRDYAWYRENSGKPIKIAMLEPNAASIFDMHGNVWEWCDNHVLRGGDCASSAHGVASFSRCAKDELSKACFVGFRIAASIVT